jgi:hypothetical protein
MTLMNFRRHASAMLIAGGLVAAVGFANAPFQARQVAAAPPAGIPRAARAGALSDTGTEQMGGCHEPFGMASEHCAMLMVKSVNGTTINAVTWDNRPVTVTVSGNTRYHQDDVNASLSDLHTGSMIFVRGSLVGENTIAASHVAIILPHVGGVVMAVNGSTLTVTGFDGSSDTITVNGQTRYERAGHAAALADIKVGTAIVADGTRHSDGSLDAAAVMIQVPHVMGRVTSVNGTSMTVSSPDGLTYTVTTSGNTLYAAPGGTPVSPASIHVGSIIVAEGTFGANRQTLSALRVIALHMDRSED